MTPTNDAAGAAVRDPYFTNLVAWLCGRTGLDRSAVERRIGAFGVEMRRYCAVSAAFLDERRAVEDRLSRRRPDFDRAFPLPSGDPSLSPLPPPQGFRAETREFLVEDSLRKERCGECDGEGQSDCAVCSGKGRIPCDTCGGTGYCNTCQGAKTVPCPSCKGEPSKPCPHCNGKGWVKRGHETVKCNHCMNGFIICEECGGRGRLDCPECFGKGVCKDCKGVGSRACIKCGAKGSIVCEACGGAGEWYVWKVVKSELSATSLSRSQRPDGLPPPVASRVTALLTSGRAVFERELPPGADPPFDEVDADIRAFVREAWASLIAERGDAESEAGRRLTVYAVPVARVSFEYGDGSFEGFFVGERKEFFALRDPVKAVLTGALERAEGLLGEGRCAEALDSLLSSVEQAAAEPSLRPRFRELILQARDASGRDFLAGSVAPLLAVALLAPSWLDWKTHLAGAAAVLVMFVVPWLAVKVLGPGVCFCEGRKTGRALALAAGLGAALPSWLLGAAFAFPAGVAAGLAVGAAAFFFLRGRLRRFSPSERNLLTLCLREP